MRDFDNALFSGALGKANNIDSSRFMTVPLTRDITEFMPKFEAEFSEEFVCCSRNGLLWLHTSRVGYLTVTALKLDEENNIYIIAQILTIPVETVRARGYDWILLQHSFIVWFDTAPYIRIATIIDTSNDTFFYSMLRITTWGNSYRTFSTSSEGLYPAGTHKMEHCYSVLPAVGDWQIVEDFLIRRPDNPLAVSEDNTGLLQARPLIPLEFNYGADPSYGAGYSATKRGIQLAMINGELWGKGVNNIGKVSILPAVFTEDGEPEEYYLYISPEYRKNNLSVDDWDNLSIAGAENVIGFMSEKSDPVTSSTCVDATSQGLLSLKDNQWESPRPYDNSKLIVDTSNGNWLALGEKGVTHNGDSYECENLPTWLAPTEKVESIEKISVISSTDNILVKTDIAKGFNRILINKYEFFSPFIYLSDKKELRDITWNNIYKKTVNIDFANVFDVSSLNDGFLYIAPILLSKDTDGFPKKWYCFNSQNNNFNVRNISISFDSIRNADREEGFEPFENTFKRWESVYDGGYWYGDYYFVPIGTDYEIYPDYFVSVYIGGDGYVRHRWYSLWHLAGFQKEAEFEYVEIIYGKVYYYHEIRYGATYRSGLWGDGDTIVRGRLSNDYGASNYPYFEAYSDKGEHLEVYNYLYGYRGYFFRAIEKSYEFSANDMGIPESEWEYVDRFDEGLDFSSVYKTEPCYADFIFKEKNTKTNFIIHMPKNLDNETFNIDINTNERVFRYKHKIDGRHLFFIFFKDKLFIFYTNDNKIFDFQSEYERSK